MDSVEQTLSTLRRTGFALVISSVAILFVATPSGQDFESPLEELSQLSGIVEGYRGHCAMVVDRVYSRIAGQLASLNAEAEERLPLSPTFGVAGVASCNLPAASAPLEAYTRFFLGPSRVQVASVSARLIYDHLVGLTPLQQDDVSLDSVYVLIDSEPITDLDAALDEVLHAGDTLRLQLVDSLGVQSADSVLVIARLRRGRGRWPLSWRMDLAGVASYPEYDRPLDWLQTTDRVDWTETRGSRVVLFPQLQPFWEEVRTLTPSEAIRHLQARADAQRGSMEVLGVEIGTGLLAWGGPLVVLAIMLYLFAQLTHLRRIMTRAQPVVRDYPWIGLFDDRLSVALVLISIVALPATANAALSIRLASNSPVGAAWAAVAALACGAMGLLTFGRLHRLRQALHGSSEESTDSSRAAPPGPRATDSIE